MTTLNNFDAIESMLDAILARATELQAERDELRATNEKLKAEIKAMQDEATKALGLERGTTATKTIKLAVDNADALDAINATTAAIEAQTDALSAMFAAMKLKSTDSAPKSGLINTRGTDAMLGDRVVQLVERDYGYFVLGLRVEELRPATTAEVMARKAVK